MIRDVMPAGSFDMGFADVLRQVYNEYSYRKLNETPYSKDCTAFRPIIDLTSKMNQLKRYYISRAFCYDESAFWPSSPVVSGAVAPPACGMFSNEANPPPQRKSEAAVVVLMNGSS
jgi:hypothetical protein